MCCLKEAPSKMRHRDCVEPQQHRVERARGKRHERHRNQHRAHHREPGEDARVAITGIEALRGRKAQAPVERHQPLPSLRREGVLGGEASEKREEGHDYEAGRGLRSIKWIDEPHDYNGHSVRTKTLPEENNMLQKLVLGSALVAIATAALAQDYPTRSVTMMVPYAAGGPTDTVARVLAQAMTKPLGQTVIVENRPSAGGIIAPQLVKTAKPDGYTILIHHIGMATIPTLYRNPGFNPQTDFEFIGLVNEVPMTIIAKASMPAKNLTEFLAYIKANK